MNIIKNRDRSKYTFANINLLGICNANCYFCLGKDIKKELQGKNQLNLPFSQWLNFNKFLNICKSKDIKKIYITGQTADGLQYEYLDELVDYLQDFNFLVGVRTNGYLAIDKILTINKMKEEIGYSIHTLNGLTNKKIMGREDIPDWDWIIPKSGENVRIAIVINRYNINEIESLIEYLSKFNNIKYIQLRRISTDTRFNYLCEDIELFEEFYYNFSKKNKQIGEFSNSQQFLQHGKEITFWRTVETSANSINYFTDGIISENYFIVEGYLNSINTLASPTTNVNKI